jgi:amidophosphoribosyltransferase
MEENWEVRHNCGVVVAHTLEDTYEMLRGLQHRGREAAGIAAISDNNITVVKWAGRMRDFDITDLYRILADSAHTFLGHVRYATSGRKEKILQDAHPHVIGGKILDRKTHIIIENPEVVGIHNGQVDESFFSDLEQKVFATDCDTERLLYYYREKGARDLLRRIPGAYTLAIADRRQRGVMVMRDRTGIKPGIIWKKDGKYGIASEDCALEGRNASFVEDLMPGVLYFLGPHGSPTKEQIHMQGMQGVERACFFEWGYIAHHGSSLNGTHVTRLRQALGEALAVEFNPKEYDYVTFLPRCPEAAAERYAERTGIPFLPVFYKMRNERAFQGSTKGDRADSINGNLYLIPEVLNKLRGKRVILVDDSIIRGNNVGKAKRLLYEEAGVAEAVLLSYTPPIGIVGQDGIERGCMFGVDMPPTDTFIARNRTFDDISAKVGMRVVYLSVEGMLRAFEKVGLPRTSLCTYCIGGEYPFK